VQQPTPGEAMQRLEDKFLLSLRQCFHVFGADHMRLRYMMAEYLALLRLYSQFFVPMLIVETDTQWTVS
jgi:hypothetical protein